MSNDEIKKFIDHSKLYTEVDFEQNKKVEEGVLDFIKGLFKSDDEAEEVVKKADPEVVKKLDKAVDDSNLSAGPQVDTDAGANAQANISQNDTSTSTSGQDNNPNTDGGQASTTTTGQDNNPNTDGGQASTTTDPDATDPRGDQTNPPANQQGVDGPADAAAQDNNPNAEVDPSKQGIDGPSNAAAMAAGQAGAAAATAPSNGSLLGRKLDTTTPNLMKAYNDGGKKATPEIKNLQTALSRLGHDPNGIDGKYGNGTYAAVQAFQKANGLSVDGQAGPGTMAAIKKALDDNFEKNKVSPGDSPPAKPETDPAAKSADATPDPVIPSRLKIRQNIAPEVEKLLALANESTSINSILKLSNNSNLIEALDPPQKAQLQKYLDQIMASNERDPKVASEFGNLISRIRKALGQEIGDAPGQVDATLAKAAAKAPVDQEGGVAQGMDQADAATKAEPKVSKELYIQSPTSAGNFNVSQMKAKYPSPYIVIPQADGTVIHGFGKLENLQGYQKNKKGSKIVDKKTAQATPPKTQGADRAPNQQAGTPNAERDGAERGVQTASKDNNMKKAIEEASMNISINGDSAAEVAELAGILKNAGMHDAKPVSDIMPHAGNSHDDMMSKMAIVNEPEMDSPCGMDEEGVEEDWDNSPDESYADTQTMTHDLSGGINRQKKAYAKAQDGDNAMAVETSIKEQLWAALNEKMTAEGRGRGKTLKASRGEKLNASRGNKLMASRGKDKKTTEGSRGKKSRGKKSRG